MSTPCDACHVDTTDCACAWSAELLLPREALQKIQEAKLDGDTARVERLKTDGIAALRAQRGDTKLEHVTRHDIIVGGIQMPKKTIADIAAENAKWCADQRRARIAAENLAASQHEQRRRLDSAYAAEHPDSTANREYMRERNGVRQQAMANLSAQRRDSSTPSQGEMDAEIERLLGGRMRRGL